MIKPARGIILVEPIKDTEKTAGGVYLPQSAQDKPMKGKVVDVGLDVYEVKMYPSGIPTKSIRTRQSDFQKGDIVL